MRLQESTPGHCLANKVFGAKEIPVKFPASALRDSAGQATSLTRTSSPFADLNVDALVTLPPAQEESSTLPTKEVLVIEYTSFSRSMYLPAHSQIKLSSQKSRKWLIELRASSFRDERLLGHSLKPFYTLNDQLLYRSYTSMHVRYIPIYLETLEAVADRSWIF